MAKEIEIPDIITVRDLATLMEVSPINIIKELMTNGIMVNINQEIDFDTAAIVAEEMGYAPTQLVEESDDDDDQSTAWQQLIAGESESDLTRRAPVITMLGHVDHGKTSLLDVIRKESVQEREAGGITQHIGAYQAKHEGQLITFLDTPGHAAFTEMRARGAQATDIAVLVVAADDGLMPQTREAIDHAKAANVPIVVALNKIDLATARPELAKQQLSELGLTPDDWDGDTLVIPVSAKENLGIDDLLEAILLTADEIDPQANPKAEPAGTVLEARTERGRGVMTTVLVQNGTLSIGDTLLIGKNYGKIKAMYDAHGKRVKKAPPSMPVSISGLNGMPDAGDQFVTVKNEKVARKRVIDLVREEEALTVDRMSSMDAFFARLTGAGEDKTLYIIVKADVQGSLEPLVTSINKIQNDEIKIDILHASIGEVSENDIMLANASKAVVFGFNVGIDSAAKRSAASDLIDIHIYSVIYHLLDDVEKMVKGMMAPVFEQVVIGRAEVRAAFQIRKIGLIAGCFMRTGEARRNGMARVIRGKRIMHEDKIASLKHHQNDVRQVREGFEFGVNVANWNDYRENDIIEFFVTRRVEL